MRHLYWYLLSNDRDQSLHKVEQQDIVVTRDVNRSDLGEIMVYSDLDPFFYIYRQVCDGLGSRSDVNPMCRTKASTKKLKSGSQFRSETRNGANMSMFGWINGSQSISVKHTSDVLKTTNMI